MSWKPEEAIAYGKRKDQFSNARKKLIDELKTHLNCSNWNEPYLVAKAIEDFIDAKLNLK